MITALIVLCALVAVLVIMVFMLTFEIMSIKTHLSAVDIGFGNLRSDNNARHEHTQSMIQKATLTHRKPLPEVWEGEGLDVMPVTDLPKAYARNGSRPDEPPLVTRIAYPESNGHYTPTPTAPIAPTAAMHPRPTVPTNTDGAKERERVIKDQLNGATLPEPRRLG